MHGPRQFQFQLLLGLNGQNLRPRFPMCKRSSLWLKPKKTVHKYSLSRCLCATSATERTREKPDREGERMNKCNNDFPGKLFSRDWIFPGKSLFHLFQLQCYGHVFRSSGLAKPILQGSVKGGRRQGRQRKRGRKTTSGNGQAWSSPSPRRQWRTENLRKLVVKLSVVPQRPSRLRDKWWWCWWESKN